MADRKISDLTALTTPASGDYLPIVDISEAAAASKNKRITIEELFRGTPDGTAAAPAIAPENDPNTGIYSAGADQLSVATNGTERLRIDSTGQIEAVSLGTAAAPTFTFTGDPDTGIYSPGANQLAISTNGTQKILIGDGNPGVTIHGRASAYPLELDTTNVYGSVLQYKNSGTVYAQAGAGASTVAGTNKDDFTINFNVTNASRNLIFASNATERLRITSDGKVGVGTSSPGYSLHFGGDTVGATNGQIALGSIVNTPSARIDGYRASGSFAGELHLYTTSSGGTQTRAVTIDSSQRVGIGTTSPSNTFHVSKSDNHGITLERTATNTGSVVLNVASFGAADFKADNAFNLQAGTSSSIVFLTNGATERARIDSSGRLLVGTSSAFPATNIFPQFQVGGTTDGAATALVFNNANTANPPQLLFGKARGGTGGSWVSVLNNDNIGRIDFSGADNAGDINTASARIECFAEKNFATNDAPGRLVFSTTADGAASPTERMRISNTGQVSINTTIDPTTAFFDGKLRVDSTTTVTSFKTSGTSGVILQSLWHEATTGDNLFVSFGTETTRVTRGSITYNRTGGVVAYNTTSDYRAKSIIGPIDNPGATIDALKVYRGVMNGATVERPMLIAHEAQEIAPYCVTGEKDAVDADGNPIYQQMDHQVLVPLLIAEIQQLRSRVAALEAQ
jgi:archaellum component FlaG (FlaF/FlaG flagellin family)